MRVKFKKFSVSLSFLVVNITSVSNDSQGINKATDDTMT